MRRHDGRVALVTGAARGIGQAYAERLAEEGAHLVAVDVGPQEQTAELVRAAGVDCLSVTCDVSSPDGVAALAAEVDERFGRCDILVNNAGVYPVRPFEEIDYDEWRRILAIDLDSVFLMCKAFVPGMRERGWGRIVNQSSQTTNIVVSGLAHYVAAKSGVVGLTRALAGELGESGITINAIAPGLTRTPGSAEQWGDRLEAMAEKQAIKRVEVPSDLVGALAFLASDDAAFVTGQVLHVNGGLVLGG
jgi:NAD(P)-dependent dehydrogenase (short-subunit alcohol dehydrogenase family)